MKIKPKFLWMDVMLLFFTSTGLTTRSERNQGADRGGSKAGGPGSRT